MRATSHRASSASMIAGNRSVRAAKPRAAGAKGIDGTLIRKRRNLGTFKTLEAAKKHERDVQYFKRH